jgi:hypothetical protein
MTAETDRPLTGITRRRWRLGVALGLSVGLLQTAPEIFEGEAVESIALRALLWAFEIPLQMRALSSTFDRAVERRLSPSRIALACGLVAVVIGTLLALAFVFLFQDLLGFALDENGPLSYPLVAGFGAIAGAPIVVVWGLAYVAPHLTEQAQRRGLEAERLRFDTERLHFEAERLRSDAERLRLEAARVSVASELASLRAQLEPHFLLNTLNTIAGLVTQRPGEARRLIGCLGDLLRDALQDHDEFQTIERELAWLRRYAEILEARHGDALQFEWDLAPAAAAFLVPRLLLQPLVENAVQHGALCRPAGGRVTVQVAIQGTETEPTLLCVVTDNGPGLPDDGPRDGAVGLHTVRRRLMLCHPAAALRLESSDAGTRATLEIPSFQAGER